MFAVVLEEARFYLGLTEQNKESTDLEKSSNENISHLEIQRNLE